MHYLGIDPGKAGCLCALEAETRKCEFFDWPKDGNIHLYHKQISDMLTKWDFQFAILEKVHAMPKQGVSSMFTFGVNYGIWQGWLIGWHIPHRLVAPQTWMKGLISKADGTTTKQQVCNAAIRMFPNADLLGPKGGYKDGRGDALLMAYYGMLLEGGSEARLVPSKSKRRSPKN